MKTLKLFTIVLLLAFCVSCEDSGVTTKVLRGDEAGLPTELIGMRVYSVSLGEGDYIKVACMGDTIKSNSYLQNKATETTIIINPDNYNMRTIHAKEIVYETNEIIVVRK